MSTRTRGGRVPDFTRDGRIPSTISSNPIHGQMRGTRLQRPQQPAPQSAPQPRVAQTPQPQQQSPASQVASQPAAPTPMINSQNVGQELGGTITADNTLRNRRLGSTVSGGGGANLSGLRNISARLQQLAAEGGPAGDSEFLAMLQGQVQSGLEGGMNREQLVRDQFQSQLPFLDEQLQGQLQDLGRGTAALGRTGGGMVNTSMGDLALRAQRGREALLGQLSSQAAGQAMQDRLGLIGAGTGLGGLELQRERAAFGDPLQALSAAVGAEGQMGSLANAAANRRMQAQMHGDQFLAQQQQREDMLGQQAFQNNLQRLGLLERGFMNDPTQAMLGASDVMLRSGGQFQRGAETAGSQLGGAAQAGTRAAGGIEDLIQGASDLFGGGGQPSLPPVSTPPYVPSGMNLDPVQQQRIDFSGII